MGATASREKSQHSSGEDNGPTMDSHLHSDYDIYPPSLDANQHYSNAMSCKDTDDLSSIAPMDISSNHDQSEKRTIPTYLKWCNGGKDVSVSGSFNNWQDNIPMVKSQDNFYTIIQLAEGSHQYKFLVDGQWRCDPEATKIDNDLGTQNNVAVVKGSDFEVFEALAMDSLSTVDKGLSSSPPGEYSQEVPPRPVSHSHHGGPPVLPPHLLQVILNKETPVHCEPTLLPEPNHVMLNHLYALSIKDGVMVLSAAHRYRKKYVTTLLYKPID